MEKSDYEDVQQRLRDIRQDLLACQDSQEESQDYEGNVRLSISYVTQAIADLGEIIEGYEPELVDEPEFAFMFYPDKEQYACSIHRTEDAHPLTKSRICFTGDDFSYSVSRPSERKSYDFIKFPIGTNFVLEYMSGKDSKFYVAKPDFASRTTKTVQKNPEKEWR